MAKKINPLVSNEINEIIMNQIYYVRGCKVMLDKDLANLYQVTTGNFNKAIQRNLKRFPADFMFQLTDYEFKNLIFQNGISSSSWGGTKISVSVESDCANRSFSIGWEQTTFTLILHSRLTLTPTLKHKIFTHIRQMLIDNKELRLAIEQIRKKTDNNAQNIELVFQYLDELIENKENQDPKNGIGFKIKN